MHDQIIDLALEECELSPRKLAVEFTETKGYFVSGASVYMRLKAHELITSSALIVMTAAQSFKGKTTVSRSVPSSSITIITANTRAWAM